MFDVGSDPDAADRLLVVIAAPREAAAVANGLDARPPETPWTIVQWAGGLDGVMAGVGKASAAGGTARVIDPRRHRGVLSLGVAGTLDPRGTSPGIGDVVFAKRSVFADDGVRLGEGVLPLDEMGFGPFPDAGMGIDGDSALVAGLEGMIDVRGVVATVSAGAGTDEVASEVRRRTGSVAEAMEGAAVGLVAARLGLPFAEVRVISNTTGDRARQRWDLDGALARLGELAGALVIPF